MSTRDELLASIADIIKDYRAGECPASTPEHVNRWVEQFDKSVRLPLLEELKHVLDMTYFSKKEVSSFFAEQISHSAFTNGNHKTFWQQVNFLNIQEHGKSQTEILKLFGERLLSQCGLDIDNCGSENGIFFYLDDVLFSGNRIRSDLQNWIQTKAPLKATVNILVIGTHYLGEWQCIEDLKKTALEAGKTIAFKCWAAIRFENRKKYRDSSEVLWPAVIPSDKTLAKYMAKEKRFPFEPRRIGGKLENNVFSGESGRQLIEKELLLAGVKILELSKNPKAVIRPLGFSFYGLGFGSTIITYRNCPNNCPLALWWGDPEATSGPFHWYPLLPRKTYAQSDSHFTFEILS